MVRNSYKEVAIARGEICRDGDDECEEAKAAGIDYRPDYLFQGSDSEGDATGEPCMEDCGDVVSESEEDAVLAMSFDNNTFHVDPEGEINEWEFF